MGVGGVIIDICVINMFSGYKTCLHILLNYNAGLRIKGIYETYLLIFVTHQSLTTVLLLSFFVITAVGLSVINSVH